MAWHVSRGTHDLTTEQQGDEPGSSDTHRHVIVFSDNSTEELHATIKSYLARSPQSPLQVLETWYRSYKDAPSNINLDNETIQVIQTDSLNDSAIESCIQELSQNITITNRFCATCHSYFGNWPSVRKTAPSYFSCHTLIIEAAARKGCHFCSLALTFLKDVDNLNLLRKIEVRMLNLGVDDTCTLSILRTHPEGQQSLWIDPPGKPCDDRYAGIAMKGVFETDAIDYEVHVPEGTEKEDMLQIAKEWLNTCDTRHEECCMANDYSLPTRLIKVSGDEPQLVLTATLRAKVQYSTLSHRWGDIEFFKLTDENLSRLLTVIPLAELPKTFQDAIHITKQLGLEYLWIDSLCILQGNADDWRFEAGRMSSVYGGSYVNIAASDATNANEGCFLKAPYSRSALRAVVKVGDKAVTREFRRTDLYLRSVLQPHLATRAWAVQEKVLPLRTIHFSMRGAYWECRSTLASEEIPEGFAFMHHIPIGLVSVRERTEFLEGWWLRLLQTYTAANLTYGKDRLPALAGIARSIFEERGGTYLAGLWYQPDPEADWQHQYDLRMQLCWSVANPRSRPQWRAPSWSWASVDGTIGFPKIFNTGGEILEDTYIDLSKAEMAYLGDDPFGGLSSGTLHFTCPSLLRGTRVGERSIRVSGRDGHNDQLFSFKPDYLSEESTFDSGKEVFLLPIFGGRTGYVTWAEGHLGDYDFAISVFGLFGLILERLEGESALFRRTGSFSFENEASLWSRADKNVSRESFLNVFAKRGHGDAEAAGAGIVDNEKYPEQRYMISIV